MISRCPLLAVLCVAFAARAAGGAVELEPPAAGELAHANAAQADGTAAVRQVGYARALPALATAAGFGQQLEWAKLADGGNVAALKVRSAGAAALRVGLRVGALPEGAILRFYPPSGTPTYELRASDVMAAFARNRHAVDLQGDALTYWSPVIEGDALAFEVELPAAADTGSLRIAMPMLSHFVTGPREHFGAPASLNAGFAQVVWTREGDSFVCPGTLVAGASHAAPVPYFLTTGRCIGDQSAASSMQPFWSADRAAPRTVAGGATLLYGGSSAGIAFVELHAQPPAGAHYAQWPGPEIASLVHDTPVALEQWLAGSAGAAQLATEAALHR